MSSEGCVPVATLVHMMEGFGCPSASQASIAMLSAGNETVLVCGSAILGLELTAGACKHRIFLIHC